MLETQTSPNPFACAQSVEIAARHYAVKPAINDVDLGDYRLAGWPLAIRRSPSGLTCLMAPLVPLYDTNATPLAPAGQELIALETMFAAIRNNSGLPKTIVAHNIEAEGPVWEALMALHSKGTIAIVPLVSWERAVLLRSSAPDAENYLTQNMSSSSRKRLRSKRRTLETDAPLVLRVRNTASDIEAGLQAFLNLEEKGWKGQAGTALKQTPRDAAYCRSILLSLAGQNRAFTATLAAGDRIIAAGLFLRSEGEVTFWKTTYDETLSKESPGVIFDMMLTEHLYQQPWFTLLDSASDETVDPTGLIWKQRRKMARVVIDLNPGSWRCRAIVSGYHLRSKLKALRNRLRSG